MAEFQALDVGSIFRAADEMVFKVFIAGYTVIFVVLSGAGVLRLVLCPLGALQEMALASSPAHFRVPQWNPSGRARTASG